MLHWLIHELIETEFPMLVETEEQGMDNYAVELNAFADGVLEQVHKHGQHRKIVFSSFHPDLCIFLSLKQSAFPVMFLTDAGFCPFGDVRAGSLREAVRFANRWNLLGIVTAAQPLVACPRLIRAIKTSGLLCFSYGVLNNGISTVKVQLDEGVDAIIVDDVVGIQKGLQRLQEESKKSGSLLQ